MLRRGSKLSGFYQFETLAFSDRGDKLWSANISRALLCRRCAHLTDSTRAEVEAAMHPGCRPRAQPAGGRISL